MGKEQEGRMKIRPFFYAILNLSLLFIIDLLIYEWPGLENSL